MKALIIIASLLLAVGCTKEQKEEAKEQVVAQLCDAGKAAAAVVAVQVSNELSCKNVAAIKAAFEAKVTEVKGCEKPAAPVEGGMQAKSIVADILCKPVIDGRRSSPIAC